MTTSNPAVATGMTAKDAAQRAAVYARELVWNAQQISVEEVQIDENDGDWLITLGLITQPMAIVSGGPKDYKIFKVDRTSGEVKWMRMRL